MTIKDLCDMVVETGECTNFKTITYGTKRLYTCIGSCPKLEGFMEKYWDNKEGQNDLG